MNCLFECRVAARKYAMNSDLWCVERVQVSTAKKTIANAKYPRPNAKERAKSLLKTPEWDTSPSFGVVKVSRLAFSNSVCEWAQRSKNEKTVFFHIKTPRERLF